MTAMLAILLPAFLSAVSPRQSVVTGRIVNRTSENSNVISVSFNHPLTDNSTQVGSLSEEGEFAFRGEMIFAQDILLKYENTSVCLYCTPGDSTHVRIDASSNEIAISGDDARTKDQFRRCMTHIWDVCPLQFPDRELPVGEYLTVLKALVRQRQDSTDRYVQRMGFDPSVARRIKLHIAFNGSAHITSYGTAADRLAMYSDPLFDADNPENFHSSNFTGIYLPNYILALNGTEIGGSVSITTSDTGSTPIERDTKATANIRRFPVSTVRDFMLYYTLKPYHTAPSRPDESTDSLRSWFSDPWFADRLLAGQAEDTLFVSRPIEGITFLGSDGASERLPETDLIARIAERHPEEDTYIAVWATWCGFCLESLPFTARLKEIFTNKTAIIYICIDSPEEKWKTIAAGLPGEHYLLDGDASQLFRSFYRLNGPPSYLMTAPGGRILSNKMVPPQVIIQLSGRSLDQQTDD